MAKNDNRGGRPPAAPVIPPAFRRQADRGVPAYRDIQELEELELWLAEQFRDFQLASSMDTLQQLLTVIKQLIEQACLKLDAVANDLRQEGYIEGQLNILETLEGQIRRAYTARADRIGETVKEKKGMGL